MTRFANRLSTIAGALAAAVLIAASIGGCARAPGASASGQAAPSRPPSGQAAAATPSATAATSALPARWTHLEPGEPFYGGAFAGPFDEITSGVAYGDGFVLVGRSINAADSWRGVIWKSPDSAEWARVVDGGATFDDMYLANVATDGRRLVALGWAVPWPERRGPFVAWVSDDGVTWQRHEEVESTDLGRIYVDGIAGSQSGFLAWGPLADGHNALMRSEDGLTWHQIEYPDADTSDISSVAPYGDGFVAVGAEHREQLVIGGPSEAARAWWSADGLDWHSATVDGGWSLTGVYPAVAGVYAVGAQECSRCVGPRIAWQSSDGRSWSSPGSESGIYPFVASNGSQIAVFDWQGVDRSVSLSDDGLKWHKAVAQLPATDYDGGVIVGSTGVLLLVAKSPVVDGVQMVHSGVLFLRGS